MCFPTVHITDHSGYGLNNWETTLQYFKDDSGYELSQWETTLPCNVVSHWLSPCPEWSLLLDNWLWEWQNYARNIFRHYHNYKQLNKDNHGNRIRYRHLHNMTLINLQLDRILRNPNLSIKQLLYNRLCQFRIVRWYCDSIQTANKSIRLQKSIPKPSGFILVN